MYDFLFSWPYLWPFLIKSVVSAMLIAVIGYGIGKLSYHEPEDNE